jgi:IS30 family transposase
MEEKEKKKNKGQIKYEERIKIEAYLKTNEKKKDIADLLDRDISVISREIKRNSVCGEYIAKKAQIKSYQRRYWVEKGRPKIEKKEVQEYVTKKLTIKIAPLDIAGRSEIDKLLGNIDFKIGKDAIYKWIKTSPFGEKYKKCLKYKGKRKFKKGSASKSFIPNRVSIDERDEEVIDMLEFGHHELDTLGSPKGSHHTGVRIIERKTKFNLTGKSERLKYSMNTFDNLTKRFKFSYSKDIFNEIFKTFTWDNGVENQKYEILKIYSYFCDAYSSWQKPIVEGSFAILRKYIPKKTKLEDISKKELKYYNDIMNNTPRACLNFLTPQEAFNIELIRLGAYKFKNENEKARYKKLEKIYIEFEDKLRKKAEKRRLEKVNKDKIN